MRCVEFACPHRTDFHIFQYFVSVVSTTYVDAGRRRIDTNQYSVTDMSRETQHGQGVPGIFFKYDIEPMALMVEERTMGLIDFLVRLAGIVGGILVCTGYAWRGGSRQSAPQLCESGIRLTLARRLHSQSGMQQPEPPSGN